LPKTVTIHSKESQDPNCKAIIIRDPSAAGSNGLPLCRICLSEDYENINPLFSPCKCSGTMKYVHLGCL
jgi:hypothetical protein